jgi:hypothetical protein
VFPGTDITAPAINISIPVVPAIVVSLGQEFPLGTHSQRLNLDSAVRANTGGAFGAASVTSIKVKQVTLSLSNSDVNNNLSNFESARVMLSSNSQTNAVELFRITFPTANTSTLTHTPTDTPELLPYVKGGELTYEVFGKARKTTSKTLDLTVSVVIRGK